MSDKQYIVSARKYRPADFKSVVGQKNLTATLKNAVQTHRLAQAYLFCGPRGVGKTSCARIFAKTINCLTPTEDGEACGHCEACRAIEDGSSFNIVELDAASNNSVDDIRNLTEQVNIPPAIGKYRVFIIDEVHMLSSQAFNAFLKTLEEPPSYVVFILATTEKHKVIPTILSRCQIYDFKRITIQDMVEHLQYVAAGEGVSAEVPALNVIAKKADGAMRDALSIFDQVAASSFGNITYESTIASLNVLDYEYYFRLVDAFRSGDIPQALLIYKEIRDLGFDSLFFVNGLANHIRDLMVAFSPTTAQLLEVADDVAVQYTQQAQSLPVDWHYAAMKLLNACDYQYRTSSNKQFLVELTLIKLCQLLNPPTPPFDRVDSDTIPLCDPATPQTSMVATKNVTATNVTSSATNTSQPDNNESIPDETHIESPNIAEAPKSTILSPSDTKAEDSATPQATSTESTAGQPSARTTRRTTRGSRTGGTGNTLRLNDAVSGGETNSRFERRREPISDESFAIAWEEFIAKNPDKQIVVSAMRKEMPKRKDAETFVVTVDHPAIRQQFETDMPALLESLRTRLNNDYIVIDVELDTATESLKQLPPQELLKDMMMNNPTLSKFLEGFDGELV